MNTALPADLLNDRISCLRVYAPCICFYRAPFRVIGSQLHGRPSVPNRLWLGTSFY